MAEVKMMIFCSDIDASLSKFKYSYETINLLNRFDETGSSVCLNGQSLKNKYDISIRNKKPGTLYLFDERILLTSKNSFGKNLKETVYFFNKIKNQSFILCSDSKMESIIFLKDENTSFNAVFESRDKRNSFLEDFRSIRQNRLFQKSFQIFAEEIILTSFGENPPPHIYGHSAVSLSNMMIFILLVDQQI